MQEVLSLEEVAKYLKVSERTVLREIKSGTLKAFKVGRSLRFRREDIEAYMNSQVIQPDNSTSKQSDDAA